MFRRVLTAIVAGTMLAAGVPAAQAGDGHRGWRGGHHQEWRGSRHGHYYGRHSYDRHRYDRHRHKSRDYSDEILIGAGIVGLAIVAGSMLAANEREPAVTWSEPPSEPVCETDEVWRRLPDGRIQYGDRTRCY